MKRNLLLILAFVVTIALATNSARRIMTFRTTSASVVQVKAQLEQLKKENEDLKKELEYKKSDQFVEEEIRNKLGMTKPGESVVMVPKDQTGNQLPETRDQNKEPNWQKWWNIFFGV